MINRQGVSEIVNKLDKLIESPIYSINPEALSKYEEEYYGKKCTKGTEMIDIA